MATYCRILAGKIPSTEELGAHAPKFGGVCTETLPESQLPTLPTSASMNTPLTASFSQLDVFVFAY